MQTKGEATPLVSKKHKSSALYTLFVLITLCFTYILTQVGRVSFSVIAPHIQKELQITDYQFGLLRAYGYSIIYLFAGLVFGRMNDKYSKKLMIIFGILIQIGALIIMGFSTNFILLLISSMILAIGGAATVPTTFLIAADNVPSEKRGLAFSIINFAIFIGLGISWVYAGVIQSFLSWRWVFFILTVPLILCALLYFFITDIRHTKKGNANPKYKDVIKFTISNYSLWCIFIASGMRNFISYIQSNWTAIFLFRNHNLSINEQAKWLTWIIPIFGVLSVSTGGLLGDFLTKKTIYGRLLVCIASCLLSLPFIIPSYITNNYIIYFILYIPSYYISEMWICNSSCMLMDIAPIDMRATITSFFYFVVTLIALSGPVLVGYLTDYLHDPFALKYILLIIYSVMYPLSAFVFLLGFIKFRKNYQIAKEEETAKEELDQNSIMIVENDLNI